MHSAHTMQDQNVDWEEKKKIQTFAGEKSALTNNMAAPRLAGICWEKRISTN